MPPNDDDLANAIRVSGPLNTAMTVDNTGATVEGGEDVTYANTGAFGPDLGTGDHTVWFSYTASADGSVTFLSTSAANVDTHLQVFEGDFSASSQVVEGSIDATTSSETTTFLSSTATFNAVQGHTYYLQLGTYTDTVDGDYNHGDVSLLQTAGPEAEPACYLRGTLVLTEAGERAVEDLRIGERVVTASGALKPVRWIGRRSYAPRFAGRKVAPVRIAAGALGENLPRRDLWVSPCHAMLVDGLLIGAGDLVNGVTVTQPAARGDIHYLHVELDEHEVILAEGAPSETFLPGAGARARFHNAAEFAALHPDAAPDPLARFCAPRATEGRAFQAAVQRIRDRAGLARAAADLGPLDGAVERIEAGRIAGWAESPDRPGAPVCLEVLADGVVVAEALANRSRGDRRSGFEVGLPELSPGAVLSVRRALDRAVLPIAA